MHVSARPATADDLGILEVLYRSLEAEMVALHPMWPLADTFPEPVRDGFAAAITDPEALVVLGCIDQVPFGFMYGRSEPLLPQAGGQRVAAIRMVFTDFEAREVGIGEAMRDTVVDHFRATGHSLFDAHVLPGHRLAKNFFESGGFSARSIIMHRNDDRAR